MQTWHSSTLVEKSLIKLAIANEAHSY